MFRLIAVLSAVAVMGLGNATVRAAERPPNFIFLLVDDWGWTDAGCFGSDLYETPNIDRLAAQGMRFTDGYAACTVCSPTRAAVMTGMSPGRTHVTDWIPGHFQNRNPQQRSKVPLMPPEWTQKLEHRHLTIAEALRETGYRTAHIGKWHLTPRSDDPDVVSEYYPDRHGFEINIAGNQWGAPGSYFWPFRRNNSRGLGTRTANFPEGGREGDYLTDTLTDHMLQIVEKFRDEPFFVYFPYYNVHTPIQGKPDLVADYQRKVKPDARHTDPVYAAMVTAVDQSVGRITAKLDELGLAENTVIILTGDNGGLDRNGRPTDNHPLREGKGSAYEGGVRVPLIALWPGMTPAGSVCHEPVVSVDYYPTLLEIAGVKGDATHNAAVDGKSLVPILKDPQAQLNRDALYWHYPHYHPGGSEPHSAIRARDWRLVEFHVDGRYELYNLADDLGETRNLAEQQPHRARELLTQLHAWRTSVGAQMPRKNPQYIPADK